MWDHPTNPMDPALERAVAEIRGETVGAAVIRGCRRPGWARLSVAPSAGARAPHPRLRGFSMAPSRIPRRPAHRSARPAASRTISTSAWPAATCVRRQSGDARRAGPRGHPRARTGPHHRPLGRGRGSGGSRGRSPSGWPSIRFGGRTGHAIVQTATGTLYEITAGRNPRSWRRARGAFR